MYFFSCRRLKPFRHAAMLPRESKGQDQLEHDFEALKKSKTFENKKGKKEIRQSQNWKNPDMETSCIVSVLLP